ncbi:MAG: hypothetical protein U0414_11655 [Polyangiaceae bacterium]
MKLDAAHLAIACALGAGCGHREDPWRQPPALEASDAAPTPSVDAPPSGVAIEVPPPPAPSVEAPPPIDAVPSASASALASASLPPGAPAGPPTTLDERSFGVSFKEDPLHYSPAFDGSMRFGLWTEVMNFARSEAARTGKKPHFTFFVNACYYTKNPGYSQIGQAHSDNEILVRRALTQQALNEGHEIGSHGVGHDDGRTWSKAQWNAEFQHFDDLMVTAVFKPIKNEDGSFVFPVFQGKEGAQPGEVGARCAKNDDCGSGQCLAVTERDSFCTQPCNMKKPCPDGLACGAPTFQEDTDVCLPPPQFPVEYDGKTLFFKNGQPNFKHPALKIYKFIGWRAPFLASNDAMFEALIEHGFLYDTSLASSPRAPYGLVPEGQNKVMLEFALMPHAGAKSIPMDYNYRLLSVTREDMEADYERSLVESYDADHTPWNVGHHFARWDDGAYLKALFKSVAFALDGCPGPSASEPNKTVQRCPGADVISFRDLVQILKAKGVSVAR